MWRTLVVGSDTLVLLRERALTCRGVPMLMPDHVTMVTVAMAKVTVAMVTDG